jgi:hypothetical protein
MIGNVVVGREVVIVRVDGGDVSTETDRDLLCGRARDLTEHEKPKQQSHHPAPFATRTAANSLPTLAPVTTSELHLPATAAELPAAGKPITAEQ